MKCKLSVIISVLLIIGFIRFPGEATQRGKPILSQVESGVYIEGDIITPEKLSFLPKPSGAIDYAFFQSIHWVSNIVLGNFTIGEKIISLFQDVNADGKVDIVAHWNIDANRLDKEGEPEKYCTPENFKRLKEIIISGQNETILLGDKKYIISPNKEGISEIEKLAKLSSNISKYKQGLRIKRVDQDEQSKEIAVYSYSNNTEDNTVDLVFMVNYFDRIPNRISPIIKYGVYCSKSIDPFAIDTVKKIRETIAKYLPK